MTVSNSDFIQSLHAHKHDHNFSAAYLHVIADAFTSELDKR